MNCAQITFTGEGAKNTGPPFKTALKIGHFGRPGTDAARAGQTAILGTEILSREGEGAGSVEALYIKSPAIRRRSSR